jgi:hypothetical protein
VGQRRLVLMVQLLLLLLIRFDNPYVVSNAAYCIFPPRSLDFPNNVIHGGRSCYRAANGSNYWVDTGTYV